MQYLEYVQSLLPAEIQRKKAMLEVLRADGQPSGDEVVAQVTRKQVLKGLPKAKVLFSEIPRPGHWVDPQSGLHVAGRPMSEFVSDAFTPNYLRIQLGHSDFDSGLEGNLVSSLEVEFEKGYNHFFRSPESTKRFQDLLELLCEGSGVHPLDVLCSIVSAEIPSSKVAPLMMNDRTSQITHGDFLGDILYLQGMLAAIVPAIFRKLYLGAAPIQAQEVGYSRRFAASFGVHTSDEQLSQMERVFDLLLFLMSYHGPGNVSTNSAVTANSGLLDPWSTFEVMAKALKGLNHGGAAQMGAFQLFDLIEKYGPDVTDDQLREEAYRRIVQNGDPGWCVGHRVIRGGDPRREAQLAMLYAEFPGSSLLDLAVRWYHKALCPVVKEHTGAATSEENVDSLTGVSLFHLGLLTEKSRAPFALCVFAMARWVGAGSEVFWKTVGDRRVGSLRVPSVKPSLVRPSAIQD
jgi:citrate synthase